MTNNWDDDEEDFEEVESTPSGFGSGSGSFMGPMAYVFAGMLGLWALLAIYSSVTSKGKTFADLNAEFQDSSSAEEGTLTSTSTKLLKKISSPFSSIFTASPSLASTPPAQSYKIPLSCIPFNCPPARMAAGMTFDEATGAIFLYGGFDEENFRDDFHFYNSETYDWTMLPPEIGSTPGKRVHVRFAAVNRFLVMFGGSLESDVSERSGASERALRMTSILTHSHTHTLTHLHTHTLPHSHTHTLTQTHSHNRIIAAPQRRSVPDGHQERPVLLDQGEQQQR